MTPSQLCLRNLCEEYAKSGTMRRQREYRKVLSVATKTCDRSASARVASCPIWILHAENNIEESCFSKLDNVDIAASSRPLCMETRRYVSSRTLHAVIIPPCYTIMTITERRRGGGPHQPGCSAKSSTLMGIEAQVERCRTMLLPTDRRVRRCFRETVPAPPLPRCPARR